MKNNELNVGDKAPDFTLMASNGKKISLKQFSDKKKVLLYFYPKDNTPGCTQEACSFRDNIKTFENKNYVVLGVSMDSIDSHNQFIDIQNLNFLLLSDVEGKISTKYGIYQMKNMYGKKKWGIVRSTFIINQKGIIEQIYSKVKVNVHMKELLTYIKDHE